MPLFLASTVADLRAASNLTPAQFGPLVTTNEMETLMAQTIAAAVDFVTGQILDAAEGKVWPFDTALVALAIPGMDASEEVARQSRQATEAAKYEALARLWELAGQLDDEYDEESDRQRKAADRELLNLVNSIKRIVTRAVAEPSVSVARSRPRSRVLTVTPRT